MVSIASHEAEKEGHVRRKPASFPSITCLLISCLCLCMYTHGARARFLKRKQKGQGCRHVDLSQAATVSRLRVQLFPLVMYSSKPLPSSSLSPLDGLYQVYHVMYHSSSSLEYGDPCLLSYTYILGHACSRDVGIYFTVCVLALCMMYVYIYIYIYIYTYLPLSDMIVTVRVT